MGVVWWSNQRASGTTHLDSLGRMPSAAIRGALIYLHSELTVRLRWLCLLSATGTPLPPRLPSGVPRGDMSDPGARLPDMELDNRYRQDEDKAQARVRDGWTPHLGRHHYASCGEWRPIMGNHDCPRCPVKCPGCGSHYNRPGPVTP